MVQAAQLKRLLLQCLFGIAKAQASYRPKVPGSQNHLDVQGVLHALEIIGWVLNNHAEALLHAQVVVVDSLE